MPTLSPSLTLDCHALNNDCPISRCCCIVGVDGNETIKDIEKLYNFSLSMFIAVITSCYLIKNSFKDTFKVIYVHLIAIFVLTFFIHFIRSFAFLIQKELSLFPKCDFRQMKRAMRVSCSCVSRIFYCSSSFELCEIKNQWFFNSRTKHKKAHK